MRRPQKEMEELQEKAKSLSEKHPDMTAAEIAEKVGVSVVTVSKWLGKPATSGKKRGRPCKVKEPESVSEEKKEEKEKPATTGKKRGRPCKVKEPESETEPTPEPEEETEEKEETEESENT